MMISLKVQEANEIINYVNLIATKANCVITFPSHTYSKAIFSPREAFFSLINSNRNNSWISVGPSEKVDSVTQNISTLRDARGSYWKMVNLNLRVGQRSIYLRSVILWSRFSLDSHKPSLSNIFASNIEPYLKQQNFVK